MGIMPLAALETTTWSVSGLLTNVTTIFTTAADLITDNPVASAFVGLALAGGGISLFRNVIHVR